MASKMAAAVFLSHETPALSLCYNAVKIVIIDFLNNSKETLYIRSAFFVKEYFPVPSSGGNQCKNRHAPIWHFG